MITEEIYKIQEDGSVILVNTIEVEIEGPTQEEIIAEKEAELLKIYAEIQALKTNQ